MDKIKVSTDWLEWCSSTLSEVEQTLDGVARDLGNLRLTEEQGADYRTRLSRRFLDFGMRLDTGTVGEGVIQEGQAARMLTERIGQLAMEVHNAALRFKDAETAIGNDFDAIGTGRGSDSNGAPNWSNFITGYTVADLTPVGPGNLNRDEKFKLDGFDEFLNFIRLVSNEFGPGGKTIRALTTLFQKDGDWANRSFLRDAAKAGVSWLDKIVSKSDLAGFFGWSTEAITTPGSSWGKKFADGFDYKLHKTYGKNIKGAKWTGIVGTVIDFAYSAAGNVEQYNSGEISADRAVVETVAETAALGAIGVAGTAIAAVILPAGAPVIAIAAAGSVVVWAADAVTKVVTQSDKGLAETFSEGVGEVWDAATNTISKGVAWAAEQGSSFLNDLTKDWKWGWGT